MQEWNYKIGHARLRNGIIEQDMQDARMKLQNKTCKMQDAIIEQDMHDYLCLRRKMKMCKGIQFLIPNNMLQWRIASPKLKNPISYKVLNCYGPTKSRNIVPNQRLHEAINS